MEIESEEFIVLFHCKDSYRGLYSHIYKSNTSWLFVTLFRDRVILFLRKLCVQRVWSKRGKKEVLFFYQASGTLFHWLMPYKEERGKVSFQCGTLKPKKDYKCNTWSLRQKLLLQFFLKVFKTKPFFKFFFPLQKKKKKRKYLKIFKKICFFFKGNPKPFFKK